jgi:hypothetical protein
MNEKDIKIILKKYSEKQEYPNLTDEGIGIWADFGMLEGFNLNCTIDKLESELISKLSQISGLEIQPQFDSGLTLSLSIPYLKSNEEIDTIQYEQILDDSIRLTKEILNSHGVSNDDLKTEYNQEQTR